MIFPSNEFLRMYNKIAYARFFPVLNSYVCNIRQIIQKLNNLFQTCHPSWSTFVRYRTVMYLCTGLSSKTYAEDTIGYIVEDLLIKLDKNEALPEY